MAKKISELNQLQFADLANDDYFQIIDDSDPLYGNTGTNKKMLVGDFKQAIFISPTLTGHVQLPNQATQTVLGNNSALTRGMGDTRYGQLYFNERRPTLEKTNNTLEDVLSLTLPNGEYHIDILLGSNSGVGGAKFAFVHSRSNNASSIKYNLIEQYGTNNAAITTSAHIANDAVDTTNVFANRSLTVGSGTVTHIYRISGIIEIIAAPGLLNATLKIQYAQNTTNAVQSILRVNSYFAARRVA